MPSLMSQFSLGRKNIVSDDNQLGQQVLFQDLDFSLVRPSLLSCMEVRAVMVKNDTGAVMVAGKGYTYKSGFLGTVMGALHGVNLVCDGICDPFLGATTVAIGESCWLIIGGPTKVLIGVGDQTINGVVQTLAAGLFGTGIAGTNPIGHSGKAMAAGTSTSLCRVLFNNPFSALK